jgi:hypothetical protein
MGYNNHFTGAITITPPLTWAEIQTSPPLQDTSLRLVETVTDTETGRTIATQAISIVADTGFSGFHVVEEIQALVDHHGAAHTFAGHIEVQFEIGLVEAGEPGCERYVVVDGRVETVTPRLVWPGETHPVLDLPMPANDANAMTVRQYLATLLVNLWDEKEGFSGKRPFGNSGWECELYKPLVVAGLIAGRIDEDGYFDELDDDAGDTLIAEAIRALGAGA